MLKRAGQKCLFSVFDWSEKSLTKIKNKNKKQKQKTKTKNKNKKQKPGDLRNL